MPAQFFLNTYAGNPLDRRSDLRVEADWQAARLQDPASQVIALWNGQPLLVERDGGLALAKLEPALAWELAKLDGQRLFLGLDGDAAVFAVDLEQEADPAEGPLQGRGKFVDLRFAGGQMPAGTPGSRRPPRRCSSGAAAIASAPPAASRPRSPRRAGSASAPPARPSTSRAPTR